MRYDITSVFIVGFEFLQLFVFGAVLLSHFQIDLSYSTAYPFVNVIHRTVCYPHTIVAYPSL